MDYVSIDYAPSPTRAELEAKAKSSNRFDSRHAETLLEILDAEGALPKNYHVPVQVIQFGGKLTMVTIGGEVVVDYSLRLKRELGKNRAVWVAGYSNVYSGYIPSKRVLLEGGYEARSRPWKDALEERIIVKVHELFREVNKEK